MDLSLPTSRAGSRVSLLLTEARSWSETGELSGKLQFEAQSDIAGPLILGVALSRTLVPNETDTTDSQQRVVIIGDADFLANAYLGNGANLSLGMNVINWLAHDDKLINIPARLTTDRQLDLSPLAQGMIGFGFLFLLPLLLGGTGFIIWWQRRKR